MAMEDGPFMSAFPNKTSIQFEDFPASHVRLPEGMLAISIAMSQITRGCVYIYIYLFKYKHHISPPYFINVCIPSLSTY